MSANRHAALKIYWERSGKPQLQFRYGDDPWVDVGGEPSWNPTFSYQVKAGHSEYDKAIKASEGREAFNQGYDRGYAKALEDMAKLLKEKQLKNMPEAHSRK